MVLAIVPMKKLPAESSAILQTPKPRRKFRPVLHRLELALRIRIVIGYMGTTVGLGHSQVRQQQRHRLGGHRRAPVGVKRELSWLDVLALYGLFNQTLGQRCRFPVRY